MLETVCSGKVVQDLFYTEFRNCFSVTCVPVVSPQGCTASSILVLFPPSAALRVSTTSLKKVCRKLGIDRWPYRPGPVGGCCGARDFDEAYVRRPRSKYGAATPQRSDLVSPPHVSPPQPPPPPSLQEAGESCGGGGGGGGGGPWWRPAEGGSAVPLRPRSRRRC
jgi:hypothetical protein